MLIRIISRKPDLIEDKPNPGSEPQGSPGIKKRGKR